MTSYVEKEILTRTNDLLYIYIYISFLRLSKAFVRSILLYELLSRLNNLVYSWGIFTISETFSKSGDLLLIGRIIMHYLCLIREIVSWILTRVIIQRWVITRVVIQPLNHKFTLNYDRLCFSWEGVCSYHGSIYLLSFSCQRLKHTLT